MLPAMVRYALWLAWSAASVAAAAPPIYRCESPRGVEYRDLPCPPGTAVVAGLISPTEYERRDDAADLAGLDFREVLALRGKPSETTVHWRGRVMTETWHWRRGGGTISLTFHRGRVAAR